MGRLSVWGGGRGGGGPRENVVAELLCHSLPVLCGTETEVPTWTCRLLKIQVPSCGHTNVGHICEQLDIAFRSDNHGVLRTPAPPHYLPQAHSRSELL